MFHSKSFIHRDIKPDNFAIGIGPNANLIYIIDYGLAKRYKDPHTKKHIPYITNKRLTGTARYSSINTHMGIEQSRRDDLECLAFSLIYLLRGRLPWQGVTAETKEDKYKKILEKKKTYTPEILSRGLPNEFAYIMTYIRSLKFEDAPDYAMLKKLFLDLFDRNQYGKDFEYDWVRLKIDLSLLFDRTTSTKGTKEQKEEEKKLQQQVILQPNQRGRQFFKPASSMHGRQGSVPSMQSKQVPPPAKKQNLIKPKEEKITHKKEEGDDSIPDENEENEEIKIPESTYKNAMHWKNYRHFRIQNTLRHGVIVLSVSNGSDLEREKLKRLKSLPPRLLRRHAWNMQ